MLAVTTGHRGRGRDVLEKNQLSAGPLLLSLRFIRVEVQRYRIMTKNDTRNIFIQSIADFRRQLAGDS